MITLHSGKQLLFTHPLQARLLDDALEVSSLGQTATLLRLSEIDSIDVTKPSFGKTILLIGGIMLSVALTILAGFGLAILAAGLGSAGCSN